MYNSLVPYIDSDKEGSDADSSSLSGEENAPVTSGKIKEKTDQKVPDKKPLVMRPKEDPTEQISKETPPKKCLVLKPKNDESSINGKGMDILPIKKCLVLKPKDEESSEVKTEHEPVKKCLVRFPKDDSEFNDSKAFSSVEGKELDKKNRRRENCISEFDKSKARLEHNNYNGLVINSFQ